MDNTFLGRGWSFPPTFDNQGRSVRMVEAEAGKRRFEVINDECVGCNLCHLVCPVPNCIDMVPVENGKPHLTWPEHPDNPLGGAD